MDDITLPANEDAARVAGRRAGQVAGKAASLQMVSGLRPDQLRAVGAEYVAKVITQGENLATAGLSHNLVAVWIQAASDAFTAEMDQVIALLKSKEASSSKH